MKKLVGVAAIALIMFGFSFEAQARPPAGHASPAFSTSTNPAGSTIGAQVLSGGGTFTNNGVIAGGSSTAITATGPAPITINNTGLITSSTQAISTSGSPSSAINNSGTITVLNSAVSSGGSASASIGTGLKQSSQP